MIETTYVSVVLDSCVMFPMPLCDTLLRVAEAQLYQLHLSQEILDGATRNLINKGRMTATKAERFQQMVKTHFPEAMVEVPLQLIAAMTNDLGDRHVVATAIVARSNIIVTSNLKHFPSQALKPWGIEAWHPDDFLVYLYELFPETMMQVIRQQSEDLRNPPMNVTELLDKLDKNNQATKFVAKIRLHLQIKTEY